MLEIDRWLCTPLSCLLLACQPASEENDAAGTSATDPTSTSGAPGTTAPSAEGSTGTPTGDTDATTEAGSGSSGSSGSGSSGETGPLMWMQGAGPCSGSRTNTMWFDDRDNGFVGCGESAEGEGLFTTIDGGAAWEANVRFNEVRIMDIRRGPDGVLYGAGIHQLDGYSAWSFDLDGATIDAVGIYQPSGTVSAVTQAENVAVTADGQALIDSLTGTAAAYRSAGGAFEELDSLSEELLSDPDALSFQVRRIVVHDDAFFGVGSRINDPARVHLPSQLAGATYHFASVELQPTTRDGELLDMHVWDSTRMLVVGVDQSTNFPLMYRLDGGDAYDAASWEQIELLDFGLDYQGTIHDLHVVDDRVVAVGAKSLPSGGFVILSEDAGQTWEDISPPGPGALSAVWMFDAGELVVAGGGGELWQLTR